MNSRRYNKHFRNTSRGVTDTASPAADNKSDAMNVKLLKHDMSSRTTKLQKKTFH